ncbi:MAG: kinase/pyrophosphorylase [Proteobacteria bacterium]|nr:kinase/pyrophosphorylase [Pseudomonadota bacterium]
MKNQNRRKVNVLVVSDATGITAERVIQAVLVQFSTDVEPVIRRFGHVKTVGQLQRILDMAENERGVVIYSLVSNDLRNWIERQKRSWGIEFIDLLGPLIDRMIKLFGISPSMHPGLLGLLGEESIRLAESIDFTMRHDDGRDIRTLGQADLIIVDLSRTSKTPTSLYLSCNHNLKAANVPIVLGVRPPRKIFTLKRPRKVGFFIEASKLSSIRRRRFKTVPVQDCVDVRYNARELDYCRGVFDRIEGIQIVDVTNCSIEEVSKQVMQAWPRAAGAGRTSMD